MILGLVSLFGIVAVICLSFKRGGETSPGYGLTGLLAAVFSFVGLILGILSFQKRDCFRILCILATALNLLVLAGMFFLFYLGMK